MTRPLPDERDPQWAQRVRDDAEDLLTRLYRRGGDGLDAQEWRRQVLREADLWCRARSRARHSAVRRETRRSA